MDHFENPALSRFLEEMGERIVVAQLCIERCGEGVFGLRHIEDAGREIAGLKQVKAEELQWLAQLNELGVFRPLLAAPDLRRGWYCTAHTPAELEQALEGIYPGFLADWFAVRTGPPPVTDYFTFTGRQSGMYRLTAKATPEQAASIVKACCAPQFCLKQRLWTVPGLAADGAESKSLIPCLEPCALLLEFARKRMRIAQETPAVLELAPTEIRGLLAAVEHRLHHPDPNLRVADFNAPENPRHLHHVQQKLKAVLSQNSGVSSTPSGREEE